MLNKDNHFRSISPNEYIEPLTLVWIESTEPCTTRGVITLQKGPYVILEGWGPDWFGSIGTSSGSSMSSVELLCTETGLSHYVTHRSFLFESYYIIK